MFKEYQSRPITRLAMQITEAHDVLYEEEKSEATVQITTGGLVFKCYEEPKVGDYVCYLNAEDIYHCNATVFAERNIVE
jgi:hypothetical protein